MYSDVGNAWSGEPAHPHLQDAIRSARTDRKKLRWAIMRWLLLGSHYLYLRRPLTQLLFWASLGGLLVWWLVDLTRLPGLVRQCNQKALSALTDEYHDMLDLRARTWREPMPMPMHQPAPFVAVPVAQSEGPARERLETRRGALFLLAAALAASVALYLFNPPALFPDYNRSATEDSGIPAA